MVFTRSTSPGSRNGAAGSGAAGAERLADSPARAGEHVERARRAMAVDQIGLDQWLAVKRVYQDAHARHEAELAGAWGEYEPAYRFAWEMRALPQYRHGAWDEVEADLRRGWNVSYRELPWDRARVAVRDAWEIDPRA